MNKEAILKLISDISPMARDYVSDMFEDIVILYSIPKEGKEGIFLRVEAEDLCVYYASIYDDSFPDLLKIIDHELDSSDLSGRETCFNVYGRNRRIIDLVQSKGFSLDIEGYILKYSEATPMDVNLGILTADGYNTHKLACFVELFEIAYERLNQENGRDTKSYSKAPHCFGNHLKRLNEHSLLRSFWLEGVLIGCYLIDGSYITDIVIHPKYQNNGYGSIILMHCIRFMRMEKGISDIYLRITSSNKGAKRLYERHGFLAISHFAEHTYTLPFF